MANEIITQGVEVGSFYDPDTGDVAQTNHIVADSFLFRQQAIENDEQDATGGRYYGGDFSELEYEFVDPDGSLYTMLKGWQEANKRVSFVGKGINRHVQWYERDRLSQVRKVDLQGSVTEGRGDKVFVRMQREGHGSHNIHSNVNLLAYLGWEDTDANGIPDGYTNRSFSSVAFTNDVFEGFASTSQTSWLIKTVPFPISGISLTQSAGIDQLHDDGQTSIVTVERNFGGSALSTNLQAASSTGRLSQSFSTGSNVYNLDVRIIQVANATAQTAKVKMKYPSLRADGSDTYVTY